MSEPALSVLIYEAEGAGPPAPIRCVLEGETQDALTAFGPVAVRAAELAGFSGKAGQLLMLPGADGGMGAVFFGLGRAAPKPGAFRSLPARLPPGDYALETTSERTIPAMLGFALGSYRFDRYKSERGRPGARLVVAKGPEVDAVRRVAEACALVRDLVNAPANDLGPAEIEAAARKTAEKAGAVIDVVTGAALLEAGYPAVHAVGRAAAPHRAPRMIEISWRGSSASVTAPHLVLVGKGVAFDSGGLDLKPSSGMRWMKKDMGGAAHVLGLAEMVMGEDLPLRLTVLIPAVENAVSGDAMRPGDVLASRAGLSIEVGNTDAEGRLILADALTRAGELAPDITIDMATLTGAARVAVGPDVVPFFTADDELAAELSAASNETGDALWRLPLWEGYEPSLDSDIADLKNDPDPWAQAGAVTAALFLKRFAPKSGLWVHLDVFAWNSRGRPGWPMGAEAQGLRALLSVIRRRAG